MPNKRKILYIVTKSVWGGAQRYVYDLATNLPKDRFEAVVVTGGNGPLIEKLKGRNIRIIKLPGITKSINIFQEVKSLIYLGRIFTREKPDVVHLNSSKFGGLGAVAAFIYKITSNRLPVTIFTAHGWPFNEDRNFLTRIIIYFFSWFTAVFADIVINIAKTDYKQSLKFPLLASNKFIYIPNGIELSDQYFLSPAESRKNLELEKEQFIIGTIAELTKNKGLNYLIDGINQIKFEIKSLKHAQHRTAGFSAGCKIIIIGGGEDKEKLQNKIDSLELQNEISLVGFKQDAGKYLKGFDILVMPSIKEGLPYVVMEAMAAGLPIIASDVGGVPDLIEHGKNGLLVKTKDSTGMAEGLKKLIQNHEARISLGKEAKTRVKTNFRFRDMLTRTITLYEYTK